MRGKLEQKPVILPADGRVEELPLGGLDGAVDDPTAPSAGDLSSGNQKQSLPRTGDRGLSDGFSRSSRGVPRDQSQNPGQNPQDKAPRGRQSIPKLDTGGSRMPPLERERSPYSSGPRNGTVRENRFSTEALLSPTIQSPKSPHHGRQRSYSQNPPDYRQPMDTRAPNRDPVTRQAPIRPTLERRVSAMPELGTSTPPSSPRQPLRKPGHYSSEESDNDHSSHRRKPTHAAPDARVDLPRRRVENTSHGYKENVRHTNSPPHTPTLSEIPRSQPLNREALLNGAAASLSGLLDGAHRRASPRGSPQISPNSSPHPSPPRTPPEPYRTRYAMNSNTYLPTSRPASPLSAPQTFSQALQPDQPPLPSGRDSRPQRYRPVSRATSPLPQSRRLEPEGPKIDVRSPSPLPSRHGKSMSQEGSDIRTPARYMPTYPNESVNLQPAQPNGRQRSMSNSEGRSPRALSVNTIPPKIYQHDVEYLSPTSENTPAHFRNGPPSLDAKLGPTFDDRHSRNSIANVNSSSQRAHSAVPAPEQATSKNSAELTLNPIITRPRSRSTAAADIPYSDQRNPDPVKFPPCPHPKAMTGYRNWFTIDGADSIPICGECRGRIFGHGYSRQFKYYTPTSASQEIQCAINDPWVRMATLASILKGSSDLSPLINLALETEDRSPCPQRTPARRDWYYLKDPEVDADLPDFRVCSHCAHSIYALFPKLDRIFKRGDSMDNEPLLCSIRSADPVRFGQYVNHCEKAQQASIHSGRKVPDMSDLIWYHKKETVISECTREQVLIGRDWHQFPQLSQCTICEECYYETVRPLIKKDYSIARAVTPVAKHINDGVSCSLYSPRMKEVFKIACEDDDLKYFKDNVASRWNLQVEIMASKMRVQQYPSDKNAQEELDRYMLKWRKMEKEKYAD